MAFLIERQPDQNVTEVDKPYLASLTQSQSQAAPPIKGSEVEVDEKGQVLALEPLRVDKPGRKTSGHQSAPLLPSQSQMPGARIKPHQAPLAQEQGRTLPSAAFHLCNPERIKLRARNCIIRVWGIETWLPSLSHAHSHESFKYLFFFCCSSWNVLCFDFSENRAWYSPSLKVKLLNANCKYHHQPILVFKKRKLFFSFLLHCGFLMVWGECLQRPIISKRGVCVWLAQERFVWSRFSCLLSFLPAEL